MLKRIKDGVRFCHFDSIADALAEPMPNKENAARFARRYMTDQCAREAGGAEYWHGDPDIKTGADAMEVFKKGWPKGLARADKELGHIELPRLPSVKRKRKRRDFGDELDIHRTYRGDHDKAWSTTERRRVPASAGGRVTLFLNYGIMSGESAEQLFWRGALAAKLVDALEATGRRVQIVIHNTIRQCVYNADESRFVHSITVKQYGGSMTIDKVIAVTGCAAFFRVVGFKLMLSHKEKGTSGLGSRDTEIEPIAPCGDNDVKIHITERVTDPASMREELDRVIAPFK